jgi:DNA recombination protein RmuC
MIVRQRAGIICKHFCLLQTLTLLALLFDFCKWLHDINGKTTSKRRTLGEEDFSVGNVAILFAGMVIALVGIAFVFWQGAASAKAEKTQLERRAVELTDELAGVRAELARTQAESSARAGFESLAVERLNALSERNTQLDGMSRQLVEKDSEILRLTGLNSKLETDLANERGNGERLTQQFRLLANDILKENSTTFTEQNRTSLLGLLDPLTRDLNAFRAKVEEAKTESLISRTELASELKNLKTLNENLSSEAHSLSTALRQDTQKQGHWGEQILLLILEKSGYLKKGIHYTYQESFSVEDEKTGEKHKKQTDVIVKLPEGRHLIIDCKVTLRAYDDYVDAADDNGRNESLKKLLKSFRDHYKGLAERNYQYIAQINSPDFVVLFAPLEPAFLLAIQKDESLWMDAYEKGVLLAGPTTVLFVLRIVENLWKQQDQNRNVQEVMERGGKLYDKFVDFVEDLQAIGIQLDKASDSYNEAMKKLTSGKRETLVRLVERLRELGVKNKKRLKPKLLEEAGFDEIEETLPLLPAEVDGEEH